MKLSKKLSLGCLILSFALLFGSCSYLPFGGNDSSQKEPKSKEEMLNELNKTKEDISKRIGTLEKELENLAGSQKRIAIKILDIKDEKNYEESSLTSVDVKCLSDKKTAEKNPDDKEKAPNGKEKAPDDKKPLECTTYIANKSLIGTKTGELEKAKAELNKVKEQIAKVEGSTSSEQTSSGFSGLVTLLLFGFAGIVGLGLLGGLYYFLNKKIEEERKINESSFRDVRRKHNEFQRLIDQLSETAKFQHEKLERQKTIIQALQNQSKIDVAQPRQITEQPVYKPEPQFPVSVENYLNKVRHQGQKATADFIGGLLIQDPNKGEEFLIVKDSALASGLFYAVPSIDRFSKGTDFTTYYQNYYDCENPSGGAVRILSPTIVSRVDGGWKLEEKGKLEVRN